MRRRDMILPCAAIALTFAAYPLHAQEAGQNSALEPEARAALDKMGTALRKLAGFTLHADVTTEMVLDNGQKIQTGGTLDFDVRRPDGLKIAAKSNRQQRDIFYDGKSLTIFAPRVGYYGTFDAPPSIGQMLDRAKTEYGLEVPLADLFQFGIDQTMTARIKSGFVVGTDTINGTICEQYAFRQELVDWQLWIRRDESALPCKVVITTTDDPSMPQYTAVLTWKSMTPPAATTFAFTPPANAKKIQVAQLREQMK